MLTRIKKAYEPIHLADSITLDLHKYGCTPYSSSVFLLKDKQQLSLLQKETADTPYFNEDLFKGFPGAYTQEASRNADGVISALANLYSMGVEGYQDLLLKNLNQSLQLEHLIESELNGRVALLNKDLLSASTVWRVYPKSYSAKSPQELLARELSGDMPEDKILKINEYNEQLFSRWRNKRNEKEPLLGYSKQTIWNMNYVPLSGMKAVMFNPATSVEKVFEAIKNILTHQHALE
jgi:glutamate/tyrosine decarboxylase-like PLP-dependent enzyme